MKSIEKEIENLPDLDNSIFVAIVNALTDENIAFFDVNWWCKWIEWLGPMRITFGNLCHLSIANSIQRIDSSLTSSKNLSFIITGDEKQSTTNPIDERELEQRKSTMVHRDNYMKKAFEQLENKTHKIFFNRKSSVLTHYVHVVWCKYLQYHLV